VPQGASRDAAAAQAAHDVLVALMPTQTATFDAALASTLSRIDQASAVAGSSVGAAAARRSDGACHHYTFDSTVSMGICTPLGEYAVNNYLRRR
jgi:hypothetical protein